MALYKAVIYVEVEDEGTATAVHLQDYCAGAVILDLDTEESDTPHQIVSVTIDWDTLELAPEVAP